MDVIGGHHEVLGVVFEVRFFGVFLMELAPTLWQQFLQIVANVEMNQILVDGVVFIAFRQQTDDIPHNQSYDETNGRHEKRTQMVNHIKA